jgi:regulator of protease activity HflC (stomatin/prohibitin superfamily)
MSFISSLLLLLVSLLVFLNGKKIPHDRTRKIIRAIAFLVAGLSALSAVFRNVVMINAGEIGVEELMGNVNRQPLNPGIHLVNPVADIEAFSTRLKDIKETIDTTSKEGLTFKMDVSLQYRLDPAKAAEVYQTIGTNETEIITSRFRSIVREITASYPIESIYSSQRKEVATAMRDRINSAIAPLGFIVEETLLRQVVLPDTLQAAVQQKLKEEQENQQMKFTLDKARQEAERRRIEAKGTADAQRIVSESLTNQTLQLRAIEATEKLAQSNNTKVVIVGGKDQGGISVQLDATKN